MVELFNDIEKVSNCGAFSPIFDNDHYNESRTLELSNFQISSSPHYRGGGLSPTALKRERTGGLSPNALTWFSGC